MKVARFEAIEISVPNGSILTRFPFPDLPNLRNAKIDRIVFYTAGTISATPLTGSTPAKAPTPTDGSAKDINKARLLSITSLITCSVI